MEQINKKNGVYFIFIWFVLVFLFFYDVILFEKCFTGGDAVMASYPNGYYISRCLKNGEFPLWNPYIFFGYPIFAEGLDGLFYPLNVLLLFLPYYLQDNYSIVLHFFLGGLFMMFFISLFIRDKIFQLYGAILWVFSGMFIYRITHFSVILSLTYIPLFFYLIECFIRKNKIIYLIIFAPIVTFEIFIGHTQILVYTFIALSVYYVLRKIELKQKILNFAILNITVFIFLGILMSAIQMLPSLDLISISIRGGGLDKDSIISSEKINFINLLNIVYPYIFGSTHNNTFLGYKILNEWSMSYMGIYTGIISFLIFFVSIKIFRQNKIIIFLWILIFFTLIFSFGSNFPVNNFILNLPGFNYFRNPIKMLAFYSFFMVFLTVFTLYNMKENNIPVKLYKIFLLAIFIIILSVTIFKIFQDYLILLNNEKIENLIKRQITATPFHHYDFQYYLNKFKLSISFVSNHILQQTILMGLYIILLILFGKGKINKYKLILIIMFLTFMEMYINGKFYNRTINKEYVTATPKIVNVLKTMDKGLFRILQWRFFENEKEVFKNGRANGTYEEFLLSKEILQPNTNINYEVFSYWGYSPLAYKKYYKFFSDIDNGTLKGGADSDKFFHKGFNTLILSGVKFILSPYKIIHNEIEETGKIENIYIYKNKKANEFVRIFTDIFYVDNDEKILELIKNDKIDFKRTALIKDTKEWHFNAGRANSKINILKWDNGKIEFDIETDNDGIAVISNYFDSEKQNKDWQAFVDGKKTRILNANYIFMGLNIEKGKHNVKIIYTPYYFKIGLIITLLASLIYFIIVIFYFKNHFVIKTAKL